MLRGLLGGFARGRRQTSAATLVLDFLAGLNDSRITYSGGANGTRVNSSGVIVAATTPRFDYDPVTLAARGLLVEEARTNLMLRSQEFDNAAWPRFGTTSITANAVTSPDGTTNADLLTMTSAGSGTFQAATGAASTAYTGTIYLRAAAPVTVNLILTTNLADPVTVACSVTTAWQRFTVNKTTSPGTTQIALQISDTGSGGTSVYLWGAQTEVGAFATSYIPTTTAAVTRTADSVVMTGTNFLSWYNQSEGTFVVSGDLAFPASGGSQFLARASDNSYNNSVAANCSSTGFGATNTAAGGVFDGNASVTNIFVANTVFKMASSYAANSLACCVNGQTVATDATATIPSGLTRLDIGADHGGFNRIGSGHIRSISYYPTARPNSLQALTA